MTNNSWQGGEALKVVENMEKLSSVAATVMNSKIYVIRSYRECERRLGRVNAPAVVHRAPVEVYDEGTNTCSIVHQKHIPPNDLGAVEIEGRVYFIIKKFPVDSGIRIPPEEMYQVDLSGWGDLANVKREAVLCYLPVKSENLK